MLFEEIKLYILAKKKEFSGIFQGDYTILFAAEMLF